MDRTKWQRLEEMLDRFGIKPIVAVVPDNRDAELRCDPPDFAFWQRVRDWQAKGWTIAMHGYQHRLRPVSGRLGVPLHNRSEFGGLPAQEQAEKIRRSWQLFALEGVSPTVWIAPAHAFDAATLNAIRAETPIRVISDGIARQVYYDAGFYWIPQQLWSLKERRSGVWTVCLHPNTMDGLRFAALDEALGGRFAGRVVSLQDIALRQRRKSMMDGIDGFLFWQRQRLSRLKRRLAGARRA
jgi:predicted deacetylase